ncbi:MAG: sugar ABC transporter permease [Nitrososphaerota archaeon]|nr:sugar ABC transporter permease [Nitrososphaerota archaeon]
MTLQSTLHRKAGLILITPIMVYFLVFFAYPMYILFYDAFTRGGRFTTAEFSKMPQDPLLLHSLTNTLYYFVATVALEFLIGFGAALVLYWYMGRLKRVFQTFLILPLVISPVAISLMWVLLLSPTFGPVDYILGFFGLHSPNWLGSTSLAMPAIIFASSWEYSPFIFLVVYAALLSVPRQLYEAASIDGMGRWAAFRHITVPGIRAAAVVGFVLESVGVMKSFALIYVLTNGGPGNATYILGFYIYQVAFSFFETHYAAALSLLFLAIVTSFVAFVLKFTSVEKYLGLKGVAQG